MNLEKICKYIITLLLPAFAALLFPQPLLASEPIEIVDPRGVDDFQALVYDNTNGLPTSEANDIVQTSDGFIWIASYGGLSKYDGNNFERISSSTGITGVNCLYVDHLDRLWVGTNDSGVGILEAGRVTMLDEKDGLKSSSVRGIAEDRRGVVYVATTGGLTMFDEELKTSYTGDSRVDEAFLGTLETDDEGIVYGVTNPGDVFAIKDGEVTNFVKADISSIGPLNSIFPDPEHHGNIYFETQEGLVYRGCLSGDDIMVILQVDISPLSQVQTFAYIDKKLWICAVNGIGILEGENFEYLKNIPLDNSISSIMVDYEGNLWFTSNRQGVMKIVPNVFHDLTKKYKLSGAVVNTTCIYDGQLFIGTDIGLEVIGNGSKVTSIPIKNAVTASGEKLPDTDLIKMLDGCRVRSILRDSENRLWISTWRSIGLLRYDEGDVVVFNDRDGLYSNNVRRVVEAGDSTFLVADTGGVNVIKDDKVIAAYGKAQGIENTEILSVCAGEDGDIICGTDGGGIYIISGSEIKHITKADGLTSEAVMRIKHSTIEDVYWVVTGNSIGYLSKDYKYTNINNFPYPNNFDIYENSRGDVWILSSSGIYVVNIRDLIEDKEDMEWQHYNISSGLPYISTANSYSELTDDGNLYIAGTSGVAMINIENNMNKIRTLKMGVPYIDVDGVRQYPDADGKFHIPFRTRRVTVYDCVFSFSLSDPLITYNLEGFGVDPVTVRRSELQPIDYTNLFGGEYRFTMELYDPITHLAQSYSVDIIKERAFFEHIWFFLLAGLFIAGVVFLIVRLYFTRKLRLLEIKHKEEAEKQRISSELDMARRIQIGILPSEFPAFPNKSEFDIFATMEPAKEVGGDFYDFFLVDDDHLCLVIADVSGKGVPAAMFMMVTKAIIQSCAMLGSSPGEILNKTNEGICSNNKLDMFVTVWVGILEISTGHMVAANAGHEYPAIKRSGGSFELFKDEHSFIVGAMEGVPYLEYELHLKPGDEIFVYTDGVPEATNSEDELFGIDRMIDALNIDPDSLPEDLLKNVRRCVDEFVGDEEQFDDTTMLCFKYLGVDGTGDK